MASSEEVSTFWVDMFEPSDEIRTKKMMGEYLLYSHGVLIGGIYDDRMLVKMVPANETLCKGFETVIPYEGSKSRMYVIEDENPHTIRDIVRAMV